MNYIESYEDYIVEERLINLYKANVIGVLFMAIFIVLYGLPFYVIWGFQDEFAIMKEHFYDKESNSWWLYGVAIFVGIIAHEAVHGIVFAFFAKKGFKSIKFGVVWKMLTPYAHCKEPLKVRAYILGVLMPFLIVGLLPAFYAIISGSLPMLFFSIFFSGAAVGDFMIFNLIYKEDRDNLILDHPTEGGCYVLKKVSN